MPARSVRPSPARRALVSALLLAGCLLAASSLVAVWADALLLDQDRYVNTVAPLAGEDPVRSAITTVVTDAIVDRVDSPVGADAIRAVVEKAVETVVSSGAFRALWTDANRVAHAQVVALLTGRDSDLLETREGEIYLELGPVVAAVTADRSLLGVDLSSVAAAAPGIEFPILTAAEIAPAQRWVRRLDRAARWLPPTAIAALAAALWASPVRWQATRRIGIGLVASGLAVLLAVSITRLLYRTQLPDTVPDAVADRLFARLVEPLVESAIILSAAALAITLIGLLAPKFRRTTH